MRSITGRRFVLLLLGGVALGSHAAAVAQPLTRVPATSLQVGVTFGGGPNLPGTLSATGAFSSLQPLVPAPGLVPYEPIGSLWTDHAKKYRWFALRDTASTFGFSADGNWALPTGAVWIKHFELELTRGGLKPGSSCAPPMAFSASPIAGTKTRRTPCSCLRRARRRSST